MIPICQDRKRKPKSDKTVIILNVQLFGDTVNTASRMESTGQKGRIHISQSTANALKEAGKGHWLKQRKNMVEAKGKGCLVTYWTDPTSHKATSSASGESSEGPTMLKELDSKPVNDRLVNWMVDLILDSVKKVVSCTLGLGDVTNKSKCNSVCSLRALLSIELKTGICPSSVQN